VENDNNTDDQVADLFDETADDAAEDVEEAVTDELEDDSSDTDDADAEGSSEDSTLKKLVNLLQKNNTPEKPAAPSDDDALPDFKFSPVTLPDDVRAALASDDPNERNRALTHVLNGTNQIAARQAVDYVTQQFVPRYTKALVTAMMQSVEMLYQSKEAQREIFSDQELAVFRNPKFKPLLAEVHKEVSSEVGVPWNDEVKTKMVKRLRQLKRELHGTAGNKSAKAQKPARMVGGTGVRTAGTAGTVKGGKKKSDQLTDEQLLAFF